MKRIILIFTMISAFSFSNERLNWDIFVGHDVYGFMKVDRINLKKDYDKYSFTAKTNLSYKVYKSMDFILGFSYETYYMPEYKDSYNILPLTFGMRYIDESKKDINPYISLVYGSNILLNEEKFPISTDINGYAEASLGVLYKDKYFSELTYKHHAFAYIPEWPSNKYWNGKMVGLNFGYRLK